MRHFELSNQSLNALKDLWTKEGITYSTDTEYREAAQNLLGYFDILVEIEMQERTRKEQLAVPQKTKWGSKEFPFKQFMTCYSCGSSPICKSHFIDPYRYSWLH